MITYVCNIVSHMASQIENLFQKCTSRTLQKPARSKGILLHGDRPNVGSATRTHVQKHKRSTKERRCRINRIPATALFAVITQFGQAVPNFFGKSRNTAKIMLQLQCLQYLDCSTLTWNAVERYGHDLSEKSVGTDGTRGTIGTRGTLGTAGTWNN
jgi:hypothetical protein